MDRVGQGRAERAGCSRHVGTSRMGARARTPQLPARNVQAVCGRAVLAACQHPGRERSGMAAANGSRQEPSHVGNLKCKWSWECVASPPRALPGLAGGLLSGGSSNGDGCAGGERGSGAGSGAGGTRGRRGVWSTLL